VFGINAGTLIPLVKKQFEYRIVFLATAIDGDWHARQIKTIFTIFVFIRTDNGNSFFFFASLGAGKTEGSPAGQGFRSDCKNRNGRASGGIYRDGFLCGGFRRRI
jgi:hypothetical protein